VSDTKISISTKIVTNRLTPRSDRDHNSSPQHHSRIKLQEFRITVHPQRTTKQQQETRTTSVQVSRSLPRFLVQVPVRFQSFVQVPRSICEGSAAPPPPRPSRKSQLPTKPESICEGTAAPPPPPPPPPQSQIGKERTLCERRNLASCKQEQNIQSCALTRGIGVSVGLANRRANSRATRQGRQSHSIPGESRERKPAQLNLYFISLSSPSALGGGAGQCFGTRWVTVRT